MRRENKVRKPVPRSDAQIQHAVFEELERDPRIAETDVGVVVEHSIVTLTGSVSSWSMKLAAQEAAHRVEGVLDVANDVDVRLPGAGRPTDSEIARMVRQTLEADRLVPDQRIRTTVSDGTVTLEGEVESTAQREDSALAIRYVRGVTGVLNRLTVIGPAVAADSVRRAIEASLERQARREARRIELDVVDGKVMLTGTVHSWSERRAVVGTVRGTPGVDVIIDDIHVEP